MQAAKDPNLQLPAYYQSSFHAYGKGNLCWEAALEVTSVAAASKFKITAGTYKLAAYI